MARGVGALGRGSPRVNSQFNYPIKLLRFGLNNEVGLYTVPGPTVAIVMRLLALWLNPSVRDRPSSVN